MPKIQRTFLVPREHWKLYQGLAITNETTASEMLRQHIIKDLVAAGRLKDPDGELLK